MAELLVQKNIIVKNKNQKLKKIHRSNRWEMKPLKSFFCRAAGIPRTKIVMKKPSRIVSGMFDFYF